MMYTKCFVYINKQAFFSFEMKELSAELGNIKEYQRDSTGQVIVFGLPNSNVGRFI